MLWMKGWLETRWRFVFMIGFGLLTILLGEQGGGLQTAEHAQNLMLCQRMIAIVAAINLAGAGIRTQSPFRAKAGLHGSTQYTLSMPVGRVRLLVVRALVGLMETAVVVALMIVLAWTSFPLIRQASTLSDLAELWLATFVCVLCCHFLSIAIATFLDEMWQVYGSYCFVALCWYASLHLTEPSINVFSFTTDASPLVTHHLPWPAMGVSVGASIVFFLVALTVARRYEY